MLRNAVVSRSACDAPIGAGEFEDSNASTEQLTHLGAGTVTVAVGFEP